jgi:hypothetical protein
MRATTFAKAAKRTGAKDKGCYQLNSIHIQKLRFSKFKKTSKKKYKGFNVFQS